MKTLARPDSPPMETITFGQNIFQIPSPHVDDAMDPLSKPLEIAQKYKSTVSDLEEKSFSQPLETGEEDESAISSDLKRKSISDPVESSKKYKSTISDLQEEDFSKRSQKRAVINLSDVELDSEDELDKWDGDSEDDDGFCGMTDTEQMILKEQAEARRLREDPAMLYSSDRIWRKRVFNPPLPPSRPSPIKDESDDDIGIEWLLRRQRETPPLPSIDDLNRMYERRMERMFEEDRKKIEVWEKESREMLHASMNLIV